MLYPWYAVFSVNLSSCNGEIESDVLISYFQLLEEFRTMKGKDERIRGKSP